MAQEGFKRKLTAILSADVEGYSRLLFDTRKMRLFDQRTEAAIFGN